MFAPPKETMEDENEMQSHDPKKHKVVKATESLETLKSESRHCWAWRISQENASWYCFREARNGLG